MTDMINPRLGEKVLDPACGTGGFLVCALEHLKQQTKNVEQYEIFHNTIKGIDKKPFPHMLALTNLILHGIEIPDIKHENALTRPIRDYTSQDRVDVILTNPPFGGNEEKGIEKGFPPAFQSGETADLFIVLVMHLLKDGGRAGIVLPDGFLFGGDSDNSVKNNIKKELLSTCHLHTIVRLPGSVFAPYTSIATNLLFFTKGKPTKEIWFYEHRLPESYKSYSKTKIMKIEEFDTLKKWWLNREENEQAWKINISEIEQKGYNLDFKNPNTIEAAKLDPKDLLNKYNALLVEIEKIQNEIKSELEIAVKR
jgi:type I restriction enzyme M protein